MKQKWIRGCLSTVWFQLIKDVTINSRPNAMPFTSWHLSSCPNLSNSAFPLDWTWHSDKLQKEVWLKPWTLSCKNNWKLYYREKHLCWSVIELKAKFVTNGSNINFIQRHRTDPTVLVHRLTVSLFVSGGGGGGTSISKRRGVVVVPFRG